MNTRKKTTPETYIKEIRRKTRRIFTAELCRKHGIQESTFYKWNKEFLEAGKKRFSGDVVREATSDEVSQLCEENKKLKEMVPDLVLRYDILKKSLDMLD